jgi:hypothetical protein
VLRWRSGERVDAPSYGCGGTRVPISAGWRNSYSSGFCRPRKKVAEKVTAGSEEHDSSGKPLKILAFEEARFGLINWHRSRYCPKGFRPLLQIQSRFRVMSYSISHETSNLRTYTFKRRARAA